MRKPCCEKKETNKGAWSKQEDQKLMDYIQKHGEGCWRSLPEAAGMASSSKSTCLLRFLLILNLLNLKSSIKSWVNLMMFFVADWSGLLRCGKSCRLRWVNYLRPDLKRGNFGEDEEDLIIKLHALLGNRCNFLSHIYVVLKTSQRIIL